MLRIVFLSAVLKQILYICKIRCDYHQPKNNLNKKTTMVSDERTKRE
jgi:hypothetical protein